MEATERRAACDTRWLGIPCRARASSTRITEICISHSERARFQGITLPELCAVAGVSERRLRDAFYECCGASPTVHLRVLALRAVRRALVDDPTARDAVTRAASDFGFWHLSRFASHYRSLFGESPSATVARARALRLRRAQIYDATAMRPDLDAARAAS
jgi:AraC family transcriptional regulator, ethanolamine operon transcriptional activator